MIRTVLKRLVLASPLHQTISRRFLLLISLDGTTLEDPIPLRYATHEGAHIVLGEPEASWWRRVPTGADGVAVTVGFKGHQVPMTATMAAGEELDESILRYLQKYPGEWTALGVDAAAGPAEMEQAAQGVAVVRFTPR
ncbi:hypothetical protein [Euzebya tangerina]|uniref:hypothetical protein n=1 Tax=Euzebya tangerina TaxID=591198 RepID=UPI000E323500|nr:hypothetical protein [Euzebya tangerina]